MRRQGSGTYVSPQNSTRAIGLVYDRDIFAVGTSPFTGLLVEEARRRADERNEKFSFFLADPSAGGAVHEDLATAIESRRIAGVLFAGEQNPEAIAWLEERVPLVALAYTPIARHRVQIDHAAIVTLGVETLAAQGCKRIALWIPVGVGIGRARGKKSFVELDAFRAALKKAGVEFSPELVFNLDELTDAVPPQPRETNQQQGLKAAREVFADKTNRPDGIVIDDDMMARGALTALSQMRVAVGKDVRIATHTNRGSDVLLGYEDKISTLAIDPAEIVTALFDQLEALLDKRETQSSPILIAPHLNA